MKVNATQSLCCCCLLLLFIAHSAEAGQSNFTCPEGTRDSGYKEGNIVRWCEINREGRLLYHGPVWRWHRNGKLEGKETYLFGNADGEWPSWHENGKPSSLGSFRNGLKVGPWKYWDTSGLLTTEVNYGTSENKWIAYYPSGAKQYAGTALKSGKIGKWTLWRQDGSVGSECDFKSGLFEIPTSAGCEKIIPLIPKGFANPMITTKMDAPEVIAIHVGGEQYSARIPDGWVSDLDLATNEGAQLLLFPKGGRWRGPGANVYLRVLFKGKDSFQKTVQDQLESIEEASADFATTSAPQERIVRGRKLTTVALNYKSTFGTDSPFRVSSSLVNYERISFFDASKHLVFMVVLTSTDKGATAGAAATVERFASAFSKTK